MVNIGILPKGASQFTILPPLFFDFPEDEKSYTISDELLFGPDILVAPIYKYKQR
ncbi:unnamed protein product, partial [marine sediment metagenome]